MPRTLRISPTRSVEIDLEDPSGVSSATPIDFFATAAESLANPLGLPALEQCLLPDDHVAIAVGAGVPGITDVVGGLAAALASVGVEPRRISVVASDPRDHRLLCESLTEEGQAGVDFVLHDPADQNAVCFAGATHAGLPLMINRRLFQAEVTLPIAATRNARGGFAGAYSGLFPEFCDVHTRNRAGATDNDARQEADEAGWMLGAVMVVMVDPGSIDEPPRVLAGAEPAVREAAEQLVERAQALPDRDPADLIIATVTGGASDQSWPSLARSLLAAESYADAGAAIALCTDLTEPLPEPLAMLLATADPELVEQTLARSADPASEGPEAMAALAVARAVDRGPVYLMSGLDADWVESIGLAPVAGADELNHLIATRGSCCVIENAQHIVLRSAASVGAEV